MDQAFLYPELSHRATIPSRVAVRPFKESPLVIPERKIQDSARRFAPSHGLIPAVFRQCWTEWRARAFQGANIRSIENSNVLKAYEKLTPDEFHFVNMRQHWAAWRVIPRSLSSVVIDRPISAIDLCCGIGESTRVLSHFLTPGSRILGIDSDARFIAQAKDTQSTDAIHCDYRVQSVLMPWQNENGIVVPPASIDLVHSIGALAFHFTTLEIEIIVKNAVRVLRLGGVLILDMRRFSRERGRLLNLISTLGFKHVKCTSSCLFDFTTQESFEKVQVHRSSEGTNEQGPAFAY